MNINISSVHFKADQKLEAFINDKVEKLDKLYDNILGAEVTLKVENTERPENKTTEIRMKIRGNDALASKTAKSFEEATDLSVDAIKKQLIRIRDKERGN
ncbi:ribosome-associated translation inhibitor RaiA [Bacteroidales bacterium OttesenSCG-928-B11]|nr:ribosome-associated translation inhibitor RaiA [Bacteroidales bacterium OttesenSCG-928-C03]MDL2311848.1 ribosome-associated translation inhibitor RaiA [Bacteroidales bacterium OttesenSCG-928-B11]MDL2325503.1 ribosome-associated translation inhibitor RaiA [Bacteroidales bacterium OttesenSCG-928-A14]